MPPVADEVCINKLPDTGGKDVSLLWYRRCRQKAASKIDELAGWTPPGLSPTAMDRRDPQQHRIQVPPHHFFPLWSPSGRSSAKLSIPTTHATEPCLAYKSIAQQWDSRPRRLTPAPIAGPANACRKRYCRDSPNASAGDCRTRPARINCGAADA